MTRCKNCKWMHGNNPRYEYFHDEDCSAPGNVEFSFLHSKTPFDENTKLLPVYTARYINDGNCRYYEPTLLGRVKGWLGL